MKGYDQTVITFSLLNRLLCDSSVLNTMLSLCLCLFDSACRACACARATVNALVCVNFKLAVSHADSAYRALCLACTASNTCIFNLKCHNTISSLYRLLALPIHWQYNGL